MRGTILHYATATFLIVSNLMSSASYLKNRNEYILKDVVHFTDMLMLKVTLQQIFLIGAICIIIKSVNLITKMERQMEKLLFSNEESLKFIEKLIEEKK